MAVTPAARRPLPRTRFTLPPGLEARRTPEARGLARDQVRLVVAAPRGVQVTRFDRIAGFLAAGDLLVVNTSATLPAALDGELDGQAVVVHACPVPPGHLSVAAASTGLLSSSARPPSDPGPVAGGPAASAAPDWAVELRRPDGAGPWRTASAGDRVLLPGGFALTLTAGYPDPGRRHGSRLWRARWRLGPATDVPDLLQRHGRPITYGYLEGRPPPAAYRTVFAHEPGSVEPASAGRPFSGAVLAGLLARGVAVAPIVLHAGVSSPEAGELPLPERFRVPAATARLVNQTRAAGGRVVAVGTTATRALESAARPGGVVAAAGWTELVLGPDRPARVVDGLITGWHEPQASHLLLLEAVAGPELVCQAYRTALAERMLWHEFGDSCLLLPRRTFHVAAWSSIPTAPGRALPAAPG
jgi:S-adenosylmethionine:tRNA ribosyltransferase-isomerase